MMDVAQPQEQLHDDTGVGAANVMPDPDVSDQFHMGEPSVAMQPLINDASAFGSDGFQPYSSPRVRMLHFCIEYRQKNVPIVLQDINCVGMYAEVCN